MFEIEPTIGIEAPPGTVWKYLIEIEDWWVPSNPEHDSLAILSDDEELREGTRIRVREQIAGLPGIAVGEITEFRPPELITWEASNARYRYHGLHISVDEGVSWKLEPAGEGTNLTAHVWASFPETFFGNLIEWSFKNVLDGVEKDYQHTRKELEYLKETVESEN